MFWGDYKARVMNVDKGNLICYYPMDEAAGAFVDLSKQNGNKTPTGVTYRNDTFPIGTKAPYWDGVNDYFQYNTASSFDGLFDGDNATIMIWFKAFSLTEATRRYLWRVRAATTDTIYCRISVDNPTNLQLISFVNGNWRTMSNLCPSGWNCVIFTANQAGNSMRYYLNGVDTDGDVYPDAFDNGNLTDANCQVGAYSDVPANPYKGWLQHFAVWKSVLSVAEIKTLGRP